MGNNLSGFNAGDEVMINIKDMDVIEQMQENHGGWNEKMIECMNGPCSLVQGLGTDVLIKAPSGSVFRVNPEILTKYVSTDYSSGSKVVMIDKEEEMKKLQVGHGGWSEEMKNLLGETVEIVQKFPEGDYKIIYAGKTWSVNPACFSATKTAKKILVGEKVKIISSKASVLTYQENHGGWSEMMSLLLDQEVEVVEVMDDGDCYVTKYGMKWMINPQCFENKEKKEVEEKNKLKKGDTVLISDNLERCKELQQYHGGWVSAMKTFLGKTAIVEAILPTGDVKVKINGMPCVFNHKLLTKIDGSTKDTTSSKSSISVGDRVKVIKDKSRVKKLQKDHGEWIDSMKLILGEKGKVKSIFPDGDLRVKIMGNQITLNPECVTKISGADSSDSDSGTPDILKMIQQMAKAIAKNDSSDSDEAKDEDSKDEDISSLLKAEHMKLFAAVKTGDYEQTKALLDLVGPNIAKKKICPLMVAVNEGHERIVELLLEKGALIDYKDSDGDTALHLAVQKNRPEICDLLINKGANVNIKNNEQITPTMLASVSGALDILRSLLTVPGVDLNIGDKDKDTALHLAIQKSRLDSVEILLAAGADITALNEKQFSPFHVAVLRGHEKILEAFLKKSGPSIVDLQKEDNFAAIHLAAINNHPGCLKLLIKYKADLNIRNGKMQTALHLAVSQRYLECVKILVESKAEMNLKDDSGDTPIHDGVRGHNMERMKKMGALIGMSSLLQLMGGIQRGSDSCEDIVIYLAQHGSKLDIKNDVGKTAITSCDDDELKNKLMNIKDGKELSTSPKESKVSKLAPATTDTTDTTATTDTTDTTAAQLQALQEQIELLEKEKICAICADRKIDCTFGCGHVCCANCATNLYECHMCRQPINSIIKMFR